MKTILLIALFLLVISNFVNCQQNSTSSGSNVDKIVSGVKGLWTDVVQGVSTLYRRLKNFFATTKEDLVKKVNDTRTYLALAIKHKDEFIQIAANSTKDQVRLAYNNITAWLDEINAFHEKVLQTTEDKVNTLQKDWSKSMRDKWNHGLDKIIQVGKNIKADEGHK